MTDIHREPTISYTLITDRLDALERRINTIGAGVDGGTPIIWKALNKDHERLESIQTLFNLHTKRLDALEQRQQAEQAEVARKFECTSHVIANMRDDNVTQGRTLAHLDESVQRWAHADEQRDDEFRQWQDEHLEWHREDGATRNNNTINTAKYLTAAAIAIAYLIGRTR